MDDHEQPPPQPQPQPPLYRRNSISASFFIPTKLITTPSYLHSAASLPPQQNGVVSDFDFISSLKSPPSSLSYTSLRDLLPSSPSTPAVNSPTTASAATASIRNRLVKQAAWAYLQPMSSSPDSSSPHFLRRFWLSFSTRNPFSACFRFISFRWIPSSAETFHRIIRAIRSSIIS